MASLVDLTIVTTKGERTVRATIVGPLAVHATPEVGIGYDAWTITHRATGLRIGQLPQKRYALACARQLVAAVAWPEDGRIPGPDQRTAREIIRAVADRAFFAHCGM